jgi:hypothetical protein
MVSEQKIKASQLNGGVAKNERPSVMKRSPKGGKTSSGRFEA